MYIHMQTLSNVIYGQFVLFFFSVGREAALSCVYLYH